MVPIVLPIIPSEGFCALAKIEREVGTTLIDQTALASCRYWPQDGIDSKVEQKALELKLSKFLWLIVSAYAKSPSKEQLACDRALVGDDRRRENTMK